MVAVEASEGEIPAGTQVLRRYSVVGKLAQGGMAEVYLARQVGPAGYNKLVVVKRVRPHLANDSDFVGMFVNEARLAAMINHPNVVQIFDLGDEPRPKSQGGGQDWFLAMEYLDGRDMLQVGRACRSHNKAVPFDVTARIIADACAGLDHAHGLKGPDGKALDLVHRDMSPENILITFEGQVKVVDFGIAKASDNLIKTQAGQIKGKLGYVAPEAILGKPVDARADVFAIGATLYLFLSGRPAFTGTNPMEIFERSLKPPTPPREVNPRVPEALDAICMKALAQDRDKRYRSAGDVRIALEGYLQSTGRPLGGVQLSQFMRILFPADKDPVRQRIDKMLAEAPVGAPLPSSSPAPVMVDDDKTNIVPPKGDAFSSQAVPDPITLQGKLNQPPSRPSVAKPVTLTSQAPAPPTSSMAAPPPSIPGPAHLRSMGVQKQVASQPSGKPIDVEMTNEDIDVRALRRGVGADAPPTVQTSLASIPVVTDDENRDIADALNESDDIDLDMADDDPGPTMPARQPTEARRFSATQMDAAAAAFDISMNGGEDLPPPPLEPSVRQQRPQSTVQTSRPPPPISEASSPEAFAPPPQTFSPPSSSPPPQMSEPAFSPPSVPPQAPAPTWVPQPVSQPGDVDDAAAAGLGPSMGIKLVMLTLGVLSGSIIILVLWMVTGLLNRLG